MNLKKQFFCNGILLTAVSLLMRSVAVSFNVYISNRVGAEAMGLFSLISTVLGFALTLATSGIGFAATKLTAEALSTVGPDGISTSHQKTALTRAVLRHCLRYAIVFSLPASLLLYALSPVISLYALRDIRAITSLRLLALTLMPTAIGAVLSGYFSAVRRVWKNALVAVVEQAVKIASCTLLLFLFFARDVESACLCVVLGGVSATLLSFFLQVLLYWMEKETAKGNVVSAAQDRTIRAKLLHTALPVAFSAYLRSGLVTVEHMLIPRGLERSGADRALSLAAYGTVHSMVFPVIFFPSAILSSFASLLIPEVAQAHAEQNTDKILRIGNRVMEMALLFSIGIAGIMRCFSHGLGAELYPNTSAGIYIRMLAPLIPIMYLDTATDAMLKGLGEQVYSMGVNIADALISVILVWNLLPRFGILGYILTVYVTESFNTVLSLVRLLRVLPLRPQLLRWVIKPLLCVILSTTVSCTLLPRLPLPSSSALQLLLHILLAVGLYLLLLFPHTKKKKKGRSE